MLKNLFIAFAAICLIASCGEPKENSAEENQDQTSTGSKDDGKHFGRGPQLQDGK